MALSGLDVVRIWEAGLWEPPAKRALTILTAVFPNHSWDDLSRLSLRERDALLLSVRRQLVGPRLESVADCTSCAAQLEFSLDSDALGLEVRGETNDTLLDLTTAGTTLRYRLPNSADLVAIASAPDVESARTILIERCVVSATRDGADIPPRVLDKQVLVELEDALAARDAASEMQIDLICPECGHRWAVVLDIADFFWTELSAHARRLLREVDTLARAYGWREVDILTISAARRQLYLDMVLGT